MLGAGAVSTVSWLCCELCRFWVLLACALSWPRTLSRQGAGAGAGVTSSHMVWWSLCQLAVGALETGCWCRADSRQGAGLPVLVLGACAVSVQGTAGGGGGVSTNLHALFFICFNACACCLSSLGTVLHCLRACFCRHRPIWAISFSAYAGAASLV